MNTGIMNKLIEDVHTVVTDAESLLEATAHDATERARAARERATLSINKARTTLSDFEETLTVRAKAAAQDADQYVHDNPWKSIGIVGAVGLLAGLLLGRR
jgi:ElaB/YqjD/DUF883 family membrane-anchored ribosome-binding protein